MSCPAVEFQTIISVATSTIQFVLPHVQNGYYDIQCWYLHAVEVDLTTPEYQSHNVPPWPTKQTSKHHKRYKATYHYTHKSKQLKSELKVK